MEDDMAPSLARHISVPVDVGKTVVSDLQTGTVYKMLIETIVNIQIDLEVWLVQCNFILIMIICYTL